MATCSPLVIPELLEQILDALDEDTIVDSARLVCKQWYLITQHRHTRTVIWNSRYTSLAKEDTSSGIECKLLTAHQLYCFLYTHRHRETHEEIFSRFRNALIHNHNRQIGVPSRRQANAVAATQQRQHQSFQSTVDINQTLHQCRSQHSHFAPGAPPLSDVVLEFLPSFFSRLFLILPFFYSITNLTIRCINGSSDGHLFMPNLIGWCPHLKHLRIETSIWIRLTGPWFQPRPILQELGDAESSTRATRLVSLTIINSRLSLTDLRDLVILSPKLKDMRVIFIESSVPLTTLSCEEFLRFVQQQKCKRNIVGRPWLENFHVSQVSTTNQIMDEHTLEKYIFGVSPGTKEVIIEGQHFGVPFLNVLRNRSPLYLTTLEIANGDQVVSNELHAYLCESPHLIHLKAPLVKILADDLFPINDCSTKSISIVSRLPIWACRNLQTLQISFISKSNVRIASGAMICRRIFGYIPRVCPNLRRLEITNMEVILDSHADYSGKFYSDCLALKSGLCQLAQLQQLQWFRLGKQYSDMRLESGDLNWMLLAEKEMSNTRRVERQKAISSWMSEPIADTESENVKPMMDNQFHGLGSLQDVKTIVEKMNAVNGFECWPLLKGISICREDGYITDRVQEVTRILEGCKAYDSGSRQLPIVPKKISQFGQFITTTVSGLRGFFISK